MVEPTPLKNHGTSSAGIMTLPTEWTNKIHVPNHQPGISLSTSVISERSWASWQRPLCLFHVAHVMCTKHAHSGTSFNRAMKNQRNGMLSLYLFVLLHWRRTSSRPFCLCKSAFCNLRNFLCGSCRIQHAGLHQEFAPKRKIHHVLPHPMRGIQPYICIRSIDVNKIQSAQYNVIIPIN